MHKKTFKCEVGDSILIKAKVLNIVGNNIQVEVGATSYWINKNIVDSKR